MFYSPADCVKKSVDLCVVCVRVCVRVCVHAACVSESGILIIPITFYQLQIFRCLFCLHNVSLVKV